MLNITKLKIWPELQAMGFEPVIFRSCGKLVAIGARLPIHGESITGQKITFDRICIEPSKFSDGKNYWITGKVENPKTEKFFRYEFGRKVEFFEPKERINEYFRSSEIMQTIKYMLQ